MGYPSADLEGRTAAQVVLRKLVSFTGATNVLAVALDARNSFAVFADLRAEVRTFSRRAGTGRVSALLGIGHEETFCVIWRCVWLVAGGVSIAESREKRVDDRESRVENGSAAMLATRWL